MSTMQADEERYDIVIAGGGAIGLTLACALADALGPSTRIAVIDRVPFGSSPSRRDIRASAVSAGSQHVLAALGIWPALAEHAQAVTAVDITDAALDDAFRPILVSYDNTVEGAEPATYILENERLTAAILAGARQRASLTLMGGATASAYDAGEHGVAVTLADGRQLHTRLLVAADGRASRLREAAGIGVVGWKYQQVGIVTTVSHEKPHRGRAMQHFLPGGPFAILPLKANRSCITWTEEESQGRAIMDRDDAGFLAEVEKRFGYRLGRIQLAGPRAFWPLEMHLARAMVADRMVLVGDAAHLVHPIAGQGLNLGLRDVAALTEVVADAARLGLDIGSSIVLGRYE
ncbi:MAG: ubiquinone biosynthesis protein UbiH, partial [Rhodospirillales bacterium]|nr:ubiquinone biosynthesis protein UbiH [Rhodospirillales bacterium]